MSAIAEFYDVNPVWTVVVVTLLGAAACGGVVAAGAIVRFAWWELADWWEMRQVDREFARWASATVPPRVRVTVPPPTVVPRPPIRVKAKVSTGPMRGQVLDAVLV